MMVAVEKWGCNEIRVSLFFPAILRAFPISRIDPLYSVCNSWDLLFSIVLGEVRDKCERWVKLPKVSVFLQGFTLNAGGTRLTASWRFLAQNFAARPRIFTRTVSVFKNRNVMSQRRNDYSSKQIGRK